MSILDAFGGSGGVVTSPTSFSSPGSFGGTGNGGGFFSGLGDMLGGFGKGGQGFGNLMDLGSLALNTYGLNKSLGIAEDQLGIMQDQEGRAAKAQNLATNNSQSLALQMTTPGTAEHEQVKQAIANGTYKV